MTQRDHFSLVSHRSGGQIHQFERTQAQLKSVMLTFSGGIAV